MLSSEDRDHEQEQEDGDRRAEAEVVRRRRTRSATSRARSRSRRPAPSRGATERTMSKTLRTLISIVMKTTVSTGREQRHGDAAEDLPLARAVGARRLEHVARDRGEPGGDHDHREAGPDPDVGDHQRRRDQLRRRARRRPRTAALKVCAADLDAVRARARRSRRRSVPSSPVVVEPTCLPDASRSSTVTPGSPSSPLLDLAGRAAARLEVAPDDAGDPARLRRRAATACSAPAGTSSGGIPVSGEQRGAARLDRRLEHVALAVGAGERRRRRDARRQRARRVERVVDDADHRVDACRASGSFWSMIRQITPAANSEIAIGMKTTVLNATDQRTRSVSTREDQPDRGHERGHDRDPDRVVLDRGRRAMSVVKSVL